MTRHYWMSIVILATDIVGTLTHGPKLSAHKITTKWRP